MKMAEEELLITYGLGYAFEKSKLLIVSEIEEKIILKRELDIMKEINVINRFQENFHAKCDLKFPKKYIVNVEEALEEKVSKTIPIITSIKTKNAKKQDYLMNEYIKRDLSQIRLRKEGYIQKDLNLIKEYLDTCNPNSGRDIEDKKENILKYNKIILKFILTSNLGNDFGDFLKKQGQAIEEKIVNESLEEKLEHELENEYLIKKKYNDLDFLNLLLFLEEWQEKHFIWDGKYTSLILCINKDGKKCKDSKSEIKNAVISFIKKKKYLYFTFGRYNKDNMFITLNNEKYLKKNKSKEFNEKLKSEQKYTILEKKEGNLYEITSNDFQEIDLDYNKELGYLLSYDDNNVYISLVMYDEKHEEVTCINKYDYLKGEMIKTLEEHFIL
jgi:hypothetical protein